MSLQSCTGFLDVDPELGLTEEDVFTTYKNFTAYFDWAFDYDQKKKNIYLAYPMWLDCNDRRFTFYSTTDAADTGRRIRAQSEIKICNLGQETCGDFAFNSSYAPIAKGMFAIIRIANRTIENIGKLKNATPEQKADLLGQAYFVRAYAHFSLCRFYGGMPYISSSSYDDWDLPRLSAHETYTLAAEDFDRAYEQLVIAGKVRRDPLPGVSGHLTGSDLSRPNGCAAKAMKARALLYAASPLNNKNGKADWEAAAKAAGEALEIALKYQYAMLSFEQYTDNFYGKTMTNETIWGWSKNISSSGSVMSAILSYPQSGYSNASGISPTQNFVDKYETKWGDPMNTEADREAAIALGHYNPQDPYVNMDPRFDKTIVHDGSVTPYANVINIYYDSAKKSWPKTSISGNSVAFGLNWGKDGTKGGTSTGYYCRKQWRGSYGKTDSPAYYKLDPLVRLAELYLNYAEAVNEAYGPTSTSGNYNLTAVDAINTVRSRVNMPDIKSELTAGQDVFRDRIRNERCVELAFEGEHYYYDIRRWKTAPEAMGQTLYGMYISTCTKDADHPNGKNYERRAIPANRQCVWKDVMYWWPFPDSEANKMINFVNNEKWQ